MCLKKMSAQIVFGPDPRLAAEDSFFLFEKYSCNEKTLICEGSNQDSIPELLASKSKASTISFQITFS
jgi:hypothetical protein